MSENDENEIFMKQLKEQFIQAANENLPRLDSLLKDNKFKEIATVAHDLKGTSGLFGLEEGAEIAKELQFSAQDEDVEKTKALIEKLMEYMKKNNILKNNQ